PAHWDSAFARYNPGYEFGLIEPAFATTTWMKRHRRYQIRSQHRPAHSVSRGNDLFQSAADPWVNLQKQNARLKRARVSSATPRKRKRSQVATPASDFAIGRTA